MFNKSISQKNRDIIKKNYNIFRAFFPPEPTPTPTPLPERTLVPDPLKEINKDTKKDKNKKEKKSYSFFAHPHQQPEFENGQRPVEFDSL